MLISLHVSCILLAVDPSLVLLISLICFLKYYSTFGNIINAGMFEVAGISLMENYFAGRKTAASRRCNHSEHLFL